MNKQKGFTLVEVLLIVLLLIIVGFAGYTVWNNNQSDMNTAENIQTNNDIVEDSSNEQLEVSSIEIVDLGVKVNDPENRNFTFKKIDVEPPFEGPSTTYYTLTPQAYLENGFDKNCETIGFIRELDEDTAASYKENSITVKDINGKYYSISGTVGGCGDDKEGWQDFVANNTQYIYDNMERL